MNILLVEPDRVLASTTKLALEAFGHNVRTKALAQTALDDLDEQLPDLIILEIQLGLHNGVEFLYEIRSYPEWEHIPVLVHTINDKVLDQDFLNSFAQLGVRQVLYKPRTTTAMLVRAVRETPATL